MPDALEQALGELKDVAPVINRDQTSTMRIREATNFTLSVGQLLGLCQKYESHPHAGIFRNAVLGRPAADVVVVERITLLAMIENKDIDYEITREDMDIDSRPLNVPVERKVLVPRGQAGRVEVAPIISELRSKSGNQPLPEDPE